MKKSIGIILSCLLVCVSVIFYSCKKKKKVSCDGTVSTYNSNIKSIIDANCVSCHSSYSSYLGLKTILDNGSFASEVLSKQTMPKNAKLSSGDLNAIQCWRESGYLEK